MKRSRVRHSTVPAVTVRAVRARDREAILEFLRGLSPETCARRFCTGCADLERAADLLAFDPSPDRRALLAVVGPHEQVVGHASYHRTGPDRAEFAVVVNDAWQRRGIGTLLALHLAASARMRGIRSFEGVAVSDNVAVRNWARRIFDVRVRYAGPEMTLEFPTRARTSNVTKAA